MKKVYDASRLTVTVYGLDYLTRHWDEHDRRILGLNESRRDTAERERKERQ